MAPQAAQPAEETLHHLTRLSQKPGVQSTLILSRDTGAIVRASGLIVSETPTANTATNGSGNESTQSNGALPPEKKKERAGGDDSGTKAEGQLRSAEEVARSVWRFFAAAGGMVDEMRGEGEDEVRLVRLRMKRCEIVVVPDAKFLLVVIHDTPPA